MKFIDTDVTAAFYTSERSGDEIDFNVIEKLCRINHYTSFFDLLESRLSVNDVVSELFISPESSVAQSNTLCICEIKGTPAMILKIAVGPVQLAPEIVEKRWEYLLERARLQENSKVQERMTLAAKFECEKDVRTGRRYILEPELLKVIMTFIVTRVNGSDYKNTEAKIIMPRNRTLEYDLQALSVSMTGSKPFKRKMILKEIIVLVEQYQQAMTWALEATAPKG